jgi:uncharacterized membrane protein YkvA (DUF1232 family)
MQNSHVLALLEEARLSPEALGAAIGVSGMTVRRWLKRPKQPVPRVYLAAIRDACYALISQGRLRAESATVRTLLARTLSNEYHAALCNLGLPQGFDTRHAMSQDDVLLGLSRIGTQSQKQHDVDGNRRKIFSFKKLGREWSQRIGALWQVIRSKKIGRLEKAVAYGALFYLLTPIDFIPDHIPFFGLLDDFGVLGIAAAYYSRRSHGRL